MKLNKKLLKELEEGRIAIDYTEKSEEGLKRLNQVLKSVLPNCSTMGIGNHYTINGIYWEIDKQISEPTVKLDDFFIYSLEDLTNGVVALEYNGEFLEDLKSVIIHSFPAKTKTISLRGLYKYYLKDIDGNWSYAELTTLPTQKLSVFIEELNKLNETKESKPQLIKGKEYWVWDNEGCKYKRAFHHNYKGVNYFDGNFITTLNSWKHHKEIQVKFTIEVEVEAKSKEEAVNRVENAIILCDDMKIK